MRSTLVASICAIYASANQEFMQDSYGNSVVGPSPYYWPHQGIDRNYMDDEYYHYDEPLYHDRHHYNEPYHHERHYGQPHHGYYDQTHHYSEHQDTHHGYESREHHDRRHYSNNITHHEPTGIIHPHIKPYAPNGYSDNQVVWDGSVETWTINGEDEFNPDQFETLYWDGNSWGSMFGSIGSTLGKAGSAIGSAASSAGSALGSAAKATTGALG